MENANDNGINPTPKKSKLGRILIYILLLGIIVFLAIELQESEAGRNRHTRQLEQQIKEQQKTLQTLNSIVQAQTSQLKEYKPYQANIRAAALRDSIYKLLPFQFGETVYIMPDSLKATINAVNISGNASEYSIKYQVRTRKGDYMSVSLTDLKK
jgi:uncharacterized protein YlxW (UPF0749 family)